MRSPFPGMDPYLEQHWRDIHHGLITYARDRLQAQLPGGLRARIEERVYVEPEEGADRSIYPNLLVVERGLKGSRGRASAGAAVAEPLVIHGDPEPTTEGFIEIIDVATVVEAPAGKERRVFRRAENDDKTSGIPLPPLNEIQPLLASNTAGRELRVLSERLVPRQDVSLAQDSHFSRWGRPTSMRSHDGDLNSPG